MIDFHWISMVDFPDFPLIGSTLNEINGASKRRIADKAHALATSVGVGFHLNLREAKRFSGSVVKLALSAEPKELIYGFHIDFFSGFYLQGMGYNGI